MRCLVRLRAQSGDAGFARWREWVGWLTGEMLTPTTLAARISNQCRVRDTNVMSAKAAFGTAFPFRGCLTFSRDEVAILGHRRVYSGFPSDSVPQLPCQLLRAVMKRGRVSYAMRRPRNWPPIIVTEWFRA